MRTRGMWKRYRERGKEKLLRKVREGHWSERDRKTHTGKERNESESEGTGKI